MNKPTPEQVEAAEKWLDENEVGCGFVGAEGPAPAFVHDCENCKPIADSLASLLATREAELREDRERVNYLEGIVDGIMSHAHQILEFYFEHGVPLREALDSAMKRAARKQEDK